MCVYHRKRSLVYSLQPVQRSDLDSCDVMRPTHCHSHCRHRTVVVSCYLARAPSSPAHCFVLTLGCGGG